MPSAKTLPRAEAAEVIDVTGRRCDSEGNDIVLAPRAEAAAPMEKRMREYLWLSHGHAGLYGDDGEMQCSRCGSQFGVWDYKRAPLEQLLDAVNMVRFERGCAEAAASSRRDENQEEETDTRVDGKS